MRQLQKKGVTDNSFFVCQNKFRGIVSVFKSKKFVEDRRYDPSFVFRSKFRDLMLEARSILHVSDYLPYLEWVNYHIQHQLPELYRYPIEFDELEGVSRKAIAVGLEKDMFWIVSRIKVNIKEINYFCRSSSFIENQIISNKIPEAIESINVLNRSLGVSFWSIQNRIALEYLNGGLESQKKYTAEVRSVYRSGLLNFIAYNTSIRNEDRVTVQKFNQDISSRISNHSKFSDSVKRYLRYKMKGEWPSDSEGIADVLCIEQSHSLVDIYDTLVNLLTYIVLESKSDDLISLAKKAINEITEIDDFRIDNLRVILNSPDLSIEYNISNKLDFHPQERVRSENNAVDAWDCIFKGMRLSFKEAISPKYHVNDIPYLIANIFKQNDDSSLSHSIFSKLTSNLSGFNLFKGLNNFIGKIYRNYPDEKWCFLNVTFYTKKFSPLDAKSGCDWGNYPKGLYFTQYLEKCQNTKSIIEVLTLLNESKFDEALMLISEKKINIPALSIISELHAYFGAGCYRKVIAFIANEGAISSGRRDLIPIKAALENYEKEHFDSVEGLLTSSIALHLLWLQNESEKTLSRLRFKASQVIRDKDVRAPVALENSNQYIPTHQLIYFLKEICIPNIIDQARVVKGSSALLDQRLDTCTLLRKIDPENSSQYEDEIIEISNKQIISAGQLIVDRTRIHVDVPALIRWVTKEISEDIYRYWDLAEVVTASEFDDVMRELLIENKLPTQFSDFDEADALLLTILNRISYEFLNNPIFGLDYYLSKRIRHQSFVGLIRGPLQEQNIISTKETGDSDYNRNDFWLSKFNVSHKETDKEIDVAFKNFSSSFDDEIIATKEHIIQIKSKEHPDGLIVLEVPPQLIPVARIMLQDNDINSFVKASVELMWVLLDRSLNEVQIYLTEYLKPRLSSIVDEFRADIKANIDGRAGYYEFDKCIGKCSVDVQHALDEASSWFEKHNNIEAFKKSFDINQAIDVSLSAAAKCLRGFEPRIERAPVPLVINVQPSTLLFLHDVLFVSLDNARVHSGLKKPKVCISVDIDVINEKFVIKTVSQTKNNNKTLTEKRLQEIRDKIIKGEYETKTKTEGGSGLFKIAAVVKQSSIGDITFGFNSIGDFEINVTYQFLMQKSSLEETV